MIVGENDLWLKMKWFEGFENRGLVLTKYFYFFERLILFFYLVFD